MKEHFTELASLLPAGKAATRRQHLHFPMVFNALIIMKNVSLDLELSLCCVLPAAGAAGAQPRLGFANYGAPSLISKCISLSSEKFVKIFGFPTFPHVQRF